MGAGHVAHLGAEFNLWSASRQVATFTIGARKDVVETGSELAADDLMLPAGIGRTLPHGRRPELSEALEGHAHAHSFVRDDERLSVISTDPASP